MQIQLNLYQLSRTKLVYIQSRLIENIQLERRAKLIQILSNQDYFALARKAIQIKFKSGSTDEMVRICVGINKALTTNVCTSVGPRILPSVNQNQKIRTPIGKTNKFFRSSKIVTRRSISCCAGESICALDTTVRTSLQTDKHKKSHHQSG